MFKNRSKLTFIALVLAIAYAIYLMTYFGSVNAETTSDSEAIGAGLATLLVLPSLLVLVVGILLGIIGFFNRSAGLQLTAAIIYASAALFFLLYAVFLIPSIVLGFIGWSHQKKMNGPKK